MPSDVRERRLALRDRAGTRRLLHILYTPMGYTESGRVVRRAGQRRAA